MDWPTGAPPLGRSWAYIVPADVSDHPALLPSGENQNYLSVAAVDPRVRRCRDWSRSPGSRPHPDPGSPVPRRNQQTARSRQRPGAARPRPGKRTEAVTRRRVPRSRSHHPPPRPAPRSRRDPSTPTKGDSTASRRRSTSPVDMTDDRRHTFGLAVARDERHHALRIRPDCDGRPSFHTGPQRVVGHSSAAQRGLAAVVSISASMTSGRAPAPQPRWHRLRRSPSSIAASWSVGERACALSAIPAPHS